MNTDCDCHGKADNKNQFRDIWDIWMFTLQILKIFVCGNFYFRNFIYGKYERCIEISFLNLNAET
jgi:hypothetical protein